MLEVFKFCCSYLTLNLGSREDAAPLYTEDSTLGQPSRSFH